jgi:hypothetical protein
MIEIEIEHPTDKSFKGYLKVDLNTGQIFVDLMHSFPTSAFLCACFDGVECFTSPVGEDGEDEGTFVSIDWLINDWGGYPQIVEALKRRKELTLSEITVLKEKYAGIPEAWN